MARSGPLAQLYELGHYFLYPVVNYVCPNSPIECLCAGFPVNYNSGPGSGSELRSEFGISLDENDLIGTVAQARERYQRLATGLAGHRHYFSIDRAAPNYMDVFGTMAWR